MFHFATQNKNVLKVKSTQAHDNCHSTIENPEFNWYVNTAICHSTLTDDISVIGFTISIFFQTDVQLVLLLPGAVFTEVVPDSIMASFAIITERFFFEALKRNIMLQKNAKLLNRLLHRR